MSSSHLSSTLTARPAGAILIMLISLVLLACTTERTVRRIDLTQQSGIYVVGYTDDNDKRHTFENRLADKLRQQDFTAFASIDDITNIINSTPEMIVDRAIGHKAVAVLMVKPVNSSDNLTRASAMPGKYKILQDFYKESKSQVGDYDPDKEAVFEVYAFILSSDKPKLVWSGTTWTFVADGMGAGIESITEILTEELVKIRQKIRSGEVDLLI